MLDYVEDAWAFEYALLPCLVAYIVFDLPIIIRRITRKIYVPIYFAFFPASYSDELLAKYFDEDDWYMVGGPFPQEEMGAARMKILTIAVLSLALTMTVSPLLTGLFSHYFLDASQFKQFVWTLGVVKAILLAWAVYDMKYTFNVSDRVPIGTLVAIYSAYWIALIYFTLRARSWVSEKAAAGGLENVISSVADFVIFDVGVGVLFYSVLGGILMWWLTREDMQDAKKRD